MRFILAQVSRVLWLRRRGALHQRQLRNDVMRLSHGYMTGEPFQLFQEMRRVRDRMYVALDRRLWPRDQTDLYMLLGCLNCLMAATDDLGYPNASEELIRAGWAYAIAIDHKPLTAKLRADLSAVAYWRNRPRQADGLAGSGLTYLASGPNAAQLHLKYGRAAARLGDADVARRAIGQARDARERRCTTSSPELRSSTPGTRGRRGCGSCREADHTAAPGPCLFFSRPGQAAPRAPRRRPRRGSGCLLP
jgi:hypothetical protein